MPIDGPALHIIQAPKMDTLDLDADVEGEERERDGRMKCSDKRRLNSNARMRLRRGLRKLVV